ncbi:E3 ubiquitin-protein ligase MARCH3-like isoform X2 [Stegodyphus dumicola]|uniref:E3 ubiquitin-protein ligase MARCH3-like isoform X2 n=1 Tax=Stegodyphus dumicola TaxID=202533 RepID=UPI0015ACE674|nr:E3 ubiquitin-protein ligase MARCH3-like isoform X2 [Stegodyphus dumicola]
MDKLGKESSDGSKQSEDHPSTCFTREACNDSVNSQTNGKRASTPGKSPFKSSTASLFTPPNIHIGHMYVYNITPEQLDRNSLSPFESPINKIPTKFQSPAASSGPICRICHEGDTKEDLVSPCRCTGTVGLVHLTCMERWLSTRYETNDKCEICNYTFATVRSPKSVLEYIRSDENLMQRRSLMGDMTCFLLLTPLAVVSSFLCVEGAKKQVAWGNSLEAGCLMALATFLVTMYSIWNILTFRYHLKGYMRWRSRNQNVRLLRVQRVSTDDDSCGNNLQGIQVIPQARENSSNRISTLENRLSTSLPAVFTNIPETTS